MPLREATDVRKKKDQLRDKIFERQIKVLEKEKEVQQFNQVKSMAISIESSRGKKPSAVLCRQNYCDHRSEKTRCF